jgi:hypothetical protein
MQLYFYMCSQFQGLSDVARLVEIMLGKGMVLTQKSASTTPGGRLGELPYDGEISAFIEHAYQNDEFINAPEIVKSWGPSFSFRTITRLKYQDIKIPRPDYITMHCVGFRFGESYNYISVLINFNIFDAPEHTSPYFEAGTQLLLDLGQEFYQYLKPWYGWVDHTGFDFLSQESIRDRKELDTLYWVNFFGPQYIEKYGADFFLDAPAWKKQKLADGGVYLQMSEFYTKPVGGEAKRKLQEYFSPSGIHLSSIDNPFDEDYREFEY